MPMRPKPINMAPEDWATLERTARRRGLSVAELVRRQLAAFLARERRRQDDYAAHVQAGYEPHDDAPH